MRLKLHDLRQKKLKMVKRKLRESDYEISKQWVEMVLEKNLRYFNDN